MRLEKWLLVGTLLLPALAAAQADSGDVALAASVEQLRNVVGEWAVVTEFFGESGEMAEST